MLVQVHPTVDRHRACIRQAAHAVIHALGGNLPYRIAVAPERTVWSDLRSPGDVVQDGIWGTCSVDGFAVDGLASPYLYWDEGCRTYIADRRGFARFLREVEQQVNEFHAGEGRGHARVAAEHRRRARAFICGHLAGPIAEALVDGQDVEQVVDEWSIDIHDPTDDLCVADAIARLLPYHDEYSHAVAVTEDALRRPAIWAMVATLADHLAEAGDIWDLHGYLPDADRHWPPSPRRKTSTLAR